MAQHDYNIANDTAANVRADINNVLEAIVSNNSGASAPSTTYANQWWYDSSNDILKIRNEADTAWIEVGTVNQDDGEFSPSKPSNTLGFPAEPIVYTSSDTYTPTPGAKFSLVEVVGAGGSGGGGGSAGAGAGAGGGAGGYARKLVDLSVLTGDPAITVGAGGVTSGPGETNGSAGGDSVYDDTSVGGSSVVTGRGGGGGNAFTAGGASARSGTTGGDATGGDLNIRGAPGGGAIASANDNYSLSGSGGSGPWGGAGRSVRNDKNGEDASPNSGSGGSGGAAVSSAKSSGEGADGIIIITEFF